MKKYFLLLMLVAFFAGRVASADEWLGTVVSVKDGDTVQVQDDKTGAIQQIRLWGIHAPETDQPFAEAATTNLSSLVLGKQVQVTDYGEDGRDHYGRIIGLLKVADPDCQGQYCPKNLDVALAQLQAGLVWQYGLHHDYPELSIDRKQQQQAAEMARVGLWADPDPVAPWVWRKQHGGNKDEIPVTVGAAVDILVDVMKLDDAGLAELRRMNTRELALLHMGLGMWIRNNFALWRGNDLLLEATGAKEPDGASAVILDALLVRLKKESS